MSLGTAAFAERVELTDGRMLDGKVVLLTSMAESLANPRPDGAPEPRKILMIDDNLRRTFVSASKQRVQQVNEGDAGEAIEHLSIKGQRVARSGSRVASVGPLPQITPFDPYGHRMVKMLTSKGEVPVLQGITEVTPTWCKVEALRPPRA